MTGYTVHTGSNEKYSSGWDQIFSATPKEKVKKGGEGAKKVAKPKAEKGGAKKKSDKKVKRGK